MPVDPTLLVPEFEKIHSTYRGYNTGRYVTAAIPAGLPEIVAGVLSRLAGEDRAVRARISSDLRAGSPTRPTTDPDSSILPSSPEGICEAAGAAAESGFAAFMDGVLAATARLVLGSWKLSPDAPSFQSSESEILGSVNAALEHSGMAYRIVPGITTDRAQPSTPGNRWWTLTWDVHNWSAVMSSDDP